jgi:hypothetical protein
MSFDWLEYLALAEELTGNAPSAPITTEARQRASVSRAYYAVFVSARNFARDKHSAKFDADKAHAKLPDWFMARPDDESKQIGSDLHRLRLDRNKADYSDVIQGLPETAKRSLTLARQIKTALVTLHGRE